MTQGNVWHKRILWAGKTRPHTVTGSCAFSSWWFQSYIHLLKSSLYYLAVAVKAILQQGKRTSDFFLYISSAHFQGHLRCSRGSLTIADLSRGALTLHWAGRKKTLKISKWRNHSLLLDSSSSWLFSLVDQTPSLYLTLCKESAYSQRAYDIW